MTYVENGILILPDELLDKIIHYMSYDEVSRLRMVSKKFDAAAQRLLNQGFLKVERYHAQCLRNVKAQLPRRESERRKHPLARHCDILTAIETRLSLLGMTFMKYVDMNFCCFIPGKVIDEIYKVLRYVSSVPTPPRAHEILQELRDISSMAMEHFDEKIAPALKQKIGASGSNVSLTPQGTYTFPGTSQTFHSTPHNVIRSIGLRQELTKLQLYIKQLNNTNTALKKEVTELKLKLNDQKKKYQEQEKRVSEQIHVIAEQSARISEQDGKISEVNRKLLEYDRYFSDIMAELSRLRDEKSNFLPMHSSPRISNINDSVYTCDPKLPSKVMGQIDMEVMKGNDTSCTSEKRTAESSAAYASQEKRQKTC